MSALGMAIEEFQVYENDEPFTNEGDEWVSSGRTREQKAKRCGRVLYNDGSQELCWGIGTTGDHEWVVTYFIRNLIQRLEDGDAFIHQFINSDLPFPPRHAKIVIIDDAETAEWVPEENVKAWAFGFDGDVSFDGNMVVVEADGPIKSNGSMIVMMQFEKDLYSPSRTRGMTLKEMKKEAFKGSNYMTGFKRFLYWFWNNIEILLTIIIIVGGFLVAWIRRKYILATGKRWRKNIFGVNKIDGWWREAPMDGDLDAAYSILKRGDLLESDEKYDNGIVGAYFLRWIEEGILTCVKSGESDRKERVNLALTDKEPSGASNAEMNLYLMVKEAAGENRILERNEFQKWSRLHYSRVCGWPDTVKVRGQMVWQTKGIADRMHVVQLKNFLQDFTLMNERDANQVMLWKDYLVYAQLFGIATKVTENFQKLYPAEFKQFTQDLGLTHSSLMYTVATTNSYASLMMYTAQQRQSQVNAERTRSSGGGGHSSFGGGGGFSGGGRGGGLR